MFGLEQWLEHGWTIEGFRPSSDLQTKFMLIVMSAAECIVFLTGEGMLRDKSSEIRGAFTLLVWQILLSVDFGSLWESPLLLHPHLP